MSQFPFSVPPRQPVVMPLDRTLQRLGYICEELHQAQEKGELPKAIATLATMAGQGCTTLFATAPKGFSFAGKAQPTTHDLSTKFVTVADMANSLRIFSNSLANSQWVPSKNDTLYLGFRQPDAVLQVFPHLQYLGLGCYGYRLPEIVVDHFYQNAMAERELLSKAAQHVAGEDQQAESMVPQG